MLLTQPPLGQNDHSGQSTEAAPAPAIAQPAQANMRDERDFSRARHHSWLVKLLKLALPASAVAFSSIFVITAVASYVPISDLAIESIGLEDGKLVMEKPQMAGFDKNNRPFDVKASSATQDLTDTTTIELDKIDAQLPMDDKSFAQIDAKEGTYNSETETLNLRKDVLVKGARGMDIELQEANIDMKTGSMVSDKPVKVTSNGSKISAESVAVEENGKRIVFKERVKMTIFRTQKPTSEVPASKN